MNQASQNLSYRVLCSQLVRAAMYCERLKREAAAPRERLDIETRRQISKGNTVWRAYPAVPNQVVQVATTVAAAGARNLP